MALRRFFYDRAQVLSDGVLTIEGDLFHHIRDVCRFGVGDRFEILPGDGRALLIEIREVLGRRMEAIQISERPLPLPEKPHITLAISVPKLPKVDWILEKAGELGVHEVRPFVSDYSFLRRAGEISVARLERWRKLVVAATQQSGRGDVMEVCSPVMLEELLKSFNQSPSTSGLFPYEGPAQVGLMEAVREITAAHPERIWLFVGSEGGFSQREVELFGAQGLKPVSMGAQILRVETACLALVSVIKYECGALC